MGVLAQSAGLLFKIDADSSDAIKDLNKVDGAISSLGSKLTSATGIATLAGAAVGTIASAAIGAGAALYDITKSAAEFGSTIFDATEKTGLGAEAISSLKVAADQSGSSLETVTKGIAKFAKGFEGTSADLERELAKVFKQIYDAKPGFEQLKIAQEKFGKSGAELIPVIKATGGNLDEFKKKCKELGLTISDDAAAKADAFGDQMDTLSGQLAGVGRTIGTALMPQLTTLFGNLSKWLAQNQTQIQGTADRIGALFTNLIKGFNAVKNWITQNGTYIRIAFGFISMGLSEMYLKAGQKALDLLDVMSTPGPPGAQEGQGGGGLFSSEDDPAKTGKSKTNDADRLAREAEARRKKAVDEARQAMQDQISVWQAGYKEREAILAASLARMEIGEKEYIRDVGRVKIEAVMDEIRVNERLLSNDKINLNEQERAEIMQKIKVLTIELRIERLKTATEITKAVEKERKEEEEQLKIEQKKLQALKDAKILKDKERFDKELADKKAQRQGVLSGVSGDQDILDPFKRTLDYITNLGPNALPMQILGQFAQGVGSIVEQFILMGKVGPDAMKKMLASVLASVAAQAAVQAIMFTAYGIAALTPWGAAIYGPAAPWFKAAALMGVVAAVAGGAGRAIAGNSFSGASSGSTSSAGGNGASQQNNFTTRFNGYQQNQNAAIDNLNRTVAQFEETMHRFGTRLDSMPPSEVLTLGASDPEGQRAIAGGYESHLSDSGGRGTDAFMRRTGFAR